MDDAAPVGSLGSARLARVDERGRVGIDGSPVTLDWWIGAEDRWHVAANEPAVRRRRLDSAPAYETAMRVPSGDVLQRVHAIGGAGDPVVVEFENDSPAPVALAVVLRGVAPGVELGATRVDLDATVALHATKPAAHAVAAVDDQALLAAVEQGARSDVDPGRVPPGESVVALLHPLAHRTRARFAIVLDHVRSPSIDLVHAPAAADAMRGWDAMLQRGMRVVLADDSRRLEIDRARVDLLLASGLRTAGPREFAALEEWGFDAEAVEVWRRLGWRARRAARRRFTPDAPPTDGLAARSDPGASLRATRAALLEERPDGVLVIAPGAPPPGEPLEVHAAPTRAGALSYAVRWHGARPALLWDVRPAPSSLRIVAPGLDPAWSTGEPSGEVLLTGSVNAAGA